MVAIFCMNPVISMHNIRVETRWNSSGVSYKGFVTRKG